MSLRGLYMAGINDRSIARRTKVIGRGGEDNHRRFIKLVEQMNHQPGMSGSATMRLSAEAVDALLATHSEIVRLLCETAESAGRRSKNRAA